MSTNTEIWLPVKGAPKHSVSNRGRVKGPKGVMKTRLDRRGYPCVYIYKFGTKRVHRLVAIAFLPNPGKKPQVNHIDCNKENNHVDNLEWVTNQENMDHAVAHGLFDMKQLEEYHRTRREAVYCKRGHVIDGTQLGGKYRKCNTCYKAYMREYYRNNKDKWQK